MTTRSESRGGGLDPFATKTSDRIDYAVAPSELGLLLVARTARGICAILLATTRKSYGHNWKEPSQAPCRKTLAKLYRTCTRVYDRSSKPPLADWTRSSTFAARSFS